MVLEGAFWLEFDAKKNSCLFKGMGLRKVLWRVGVLASESLESMGEDILLHQTTDGSGQRTRM